MPRRTLRRAVALVGLAAVVYGVASLTGGWLGTPPWWERNVHETVTEQMTSGDSVGVFGTSTYSATVDREPRDGREWISGGVAEAGLALVALAAWPRRSTPPDTRGRGSIRSP